MSELPSGESAIRIPQREQERTPADSSAPDPPPLSESLTGDGLALAGIITGWIGVGVTVLMLLLFLVPILFFGFFVISGELTHWFVMKSSL